MRVSVSPCLVAVARHLCGKVVPLHHWWKTMSVVNWPRSYAVTLSADFFCFSCNHRLIRFVVFAVTLSKFPSSWRLGRSWRNGLPTLCATTYITSRGVCFEMQTGVLVGAAVALRFPLREWSNRIRFVSKAPSTWILLHIKFAHARGSVLSSIVSSALFENV